MAVPDSGYTQSAWLNGRQREPPPVSQANNIKLSA